MAAGWGGPIGSGQYMAAASAVPTRPCPPGRGRDGGGAERREQYAVGALEDEAAALCAAWRRRAAGPGGARHPRGERHGRGQAHV